MTAITVIVLMIFIGCMVPSELASRVRRERFRKIQTKMSLVMLSIKPLRREVLSMALAPEARVPARLSLSAVTTRRSSLSKSKREAQWLEFLPAFNERGKDQYFAVEGRILCR